ncbi:NADPH-dependent FMN reductase [Dyella telluris]|uniref:NAD(P)H-dependent oxidoreductase n=1 Tax=Dyella telluris TaxID=2763498 RepID=A0A7G8Q012_9GAMM|nr:NADPH-dependent FMN reductase [Dyella telluris]QNK00120.1 NAD(P)H-dependent oxidoreductase [Dyella telluris]
MKLLAISGSARQDSTNTALLHAMKHLAPDGVELSIFHRLDTLPVFSPDAEGEKTPVAVLRLLEQIGKADGIIIASPEYVRSIPGGMKNAIDWMVSRFEIIGKPIALAHASHRGDEMLASLRTVLATVSDGFLPHVFLRMPLVGKHPEDIAALIAEPTQASQVARFLTDLTTAIRSRQGG